MMCYRQRPTIFSRKECNSIRRRSMPPIFLEIGGTVNRRHFYIVRKHYLSTFSFLHIEKNCS